MLEIANFINFFVKNVFRMTFASVFFCKIKKIIMNKVSDLILESSKIIQNFFLDQNNQLWAYRNHWSGWGVQYPMCSLPYKFL